MKTGTCTNKNRFPPMLIMLLFLMLVLAGCVPVIAPDQGPKLMAVAEGMADNSYQGSKYYLLPADQNINIDSLTWKEYTQYVNRILIKRGFTEVDDPSKAEMVVFISYGIGEPEKNIATYNMPIFGQTGYSSSKTNGTISPGLAGTKNYSSTTAYNPTYGVIGYAPQTQTRISFTRFFQITAIDAVEYQKTSRKIERWRTSVISTGESSDLRRVFPVLVAVAAPYVSTNTPGRQEVIIKENSPAVLFVKGMGQNDIAGQK